MSFYNQSSDMSNFVSSFTSDPRGGFGIYAKGYRMAADRLATELLHAPRFSDYEAYPVVFLYRHAIELSLKHIVYSAANLATYMFIEDIDNSLRKEHRLDALVKIAQTSMYQIFPEDEFLHDLFPLITKTCLELTKIDPNSFSYRYPIKNDGSPSTEWNQTVNLGDFAKHMSSLLEQMETIHFGLDGETYIAQDAFSETLRSGLA